MGGRRLVTCWSTPATKTAFDNTFMLAASTGVSVLFSSGDDGDNFADFGLTAPDYPPSSPFVTAVGGTTLEVNTDNARQAEYGWSTAKQTLCGPVADQELWLRDHPGRQRSPGRPAVAAARATPTSSPSTRPGSCRSRSRCATRRCSGRSPLRVVPDISMDADAQSGMLIGLTQTFPARRPLRPVQGGRHQPCLPAAGRRDRGRRPGGGRAARFPQPGPLQGRRRGPRRRSTTSCRRRIRTRRPWSALTSRTRSTARTGSSSASGRSTTRGPRPTATARATARRAT